MDICKKKSPNNSKTKKNETKECKDINKKMQNQSSLNSKSFVKYEITEHDKNVYLDTNFRGRNEEIKTIIKNFKYQDLSSWAKVLCSIEFRSIFPNKKYIEELFKQNEKDERIFEELMIMDPLNYIYWRDSIKYEQLFPTTDQKNNPICWAHAVASAIVLTSKRIIGRDALEFENVKKDLIKKYGNKGQNTSTVLSEVLPKYNLRFEKVSENDINLFNPNGSYRFYVCSFYLTGEKWYDFSNFFNDPKKKYKCLTSNDLNKTKQNKKYRKFDGGHSVILIDADNSSLTFLNSWGIEWGDQGKFTVSRDLLSDMNFEFYNIYWLYSDLSDIEKKCYENRRKNAIKAFYRIINYTNLILPDKNEEDVKNLLTIFGDDYWRCGTNNVFRKKIPKNTMEISRFNSFNIGVKLYILDIIINLKKEKFDNFS